MKKYTAPSISIKKFGSIIEMTASGGTEPTQQPYVTGLDSVAAENRRQVQKSQMTAITQFTF